MSKNLTLDSNFEYPNRKLDRKSRNYKYVVDQNVF